MDSKRGWCGRILGVMATSKPSASVNLHNTPLVQRLSSLTAALLRAAYPPQFGGAPLRPLSPAEDYVRNCMLSAGELVTACDQLQYAPVYLSGYHRRSTADGSLITRADHVAYQVENFMIRLGTVTDRALKLVNVVFQLGIQPKECRWSVVAENAHVAPTAVRKRLDAIEQAVRPHRAARNRIVHQERYSDEQLKKWEVFFVLEKSCAESDPLIRRYRTFYKTMADRDVRSRREELSVLSNGVSDRIARLLESLLPVVERTNQRLSDTQP